MRSFGKTAVAVALVAVCAVIAAAAPAAKAQSGATWSTTLQSGILVELNTLRASHHLHALTLSPALGAAASAHTKEMAAKGYFKHESANGAAFWKRIQRYYGAGGYGTWSVGENLLWSSPDVESATAIQLWLNSPEHKRNMLNPRWREIGIAALHVSSAPGVYGAQEVTIVTTDFGARS